MKISPASRFLCAALLILGTSISLHADGPLVIGDGKSTPPADEPPTSQPHTNIGVRPGVIVAPAPGGPNAVNPGVRQVPGAMFAPIDPEKARLATEEDIKSALDATDDQWKVIQPKLDKVLKLLPSPVPRIVRAPAGNNAPRPAAIVVGRVPAANAQPEDPAAAQLSDLRTAADDKDATPEQLKEKVAALRAARAKAKEDLTKAQDDLRQGLTPRQEAVLISRGILD